MEKEGSERGRTGNRTDKIAILKPSEHKPQVQFPPTESGGSQRSFSSSR